MRNLFLSIFFVVIIQNCFSQDSYDRKVFYFFGSYDCAHCQDTVLQNRIADINSYLRQTSDSSQYHFVMVCFDKDLQKAVDFTRKFGEWDEISLGARYKNEMSLRLLNRTELPGTPHILVVNETLTARERFKSIPLIENEEIEVDLIGTANILNWIAEEARWF